MSRDAHIRDETYLRHIADAIDRIDRYTSDGEALFLQDTRTQDAVLRNLEIVGEAVKKLSDTFKTRYPRIPWREIAGMRDRLIHDYFGVNLSLVWNTVVNDLPALRDTVQLALRRPETLNT